MRKDEIHCDRVLWWRLRQTLHCCFCGRVSRRRNIDDTTCEFCGVVNALHNETDRVHPAEGIGWRRDAWTVTKDSAE